MREDEVGFFGAKTVPTVFLFKVFTSVPRSRVMDYLGLQREREREGDIYEIIKKKV